MQQLYCNALKAGILSAGLAVWGQTAVNVTFSSVTSQSLQQEFISGTTSQYLSTVSQSPFFANTYSLVIRGKNPAYVPPVVSSPIATATAVDALLAYGVGNGMDIERAQVVNLIYGTQGAEYANGTCGGNKIVSSTATVSISTTTAFHQCLSAYNLMVSTISQRWGYVYDQTGTKVGP